MTGNHPGILMNIISFLSPLSCVLQKNTGCTHMFSMSKRINKMIYESKQKEQMNCSIIHVFDVDKCKYHCKAIPIYALLQNRINACKQGEYIHFSTLAQARFMLHHKPGLVSETCCGGKGYRWNFYNKKKMHPLLQTQPSNDD